MKFPEVSGHLSSGNIPGAGPFPVNGTSLSSSWFRFLGARGAESYAVLRAFNLICNQKVKVARTRVRELEPDSARVGFA